MNKKPYELLKEGVLASAKNTEGNKEGLIKFLDEEHPGDVLFTKWTDPPIMERGKGSRVWDVDGNEYIDCISAMSAMNIGHGDERVAKVLSDQYMKLAHWFDFPTPERQKLIERLIALTPGDFPKRVRLGLSGSDAVENAVRAARSYTGKQQIISFYGGYHGQSVATMGLTGSGAMHSMYNPVPPADHCIERFPYAYCYRCPYDKEECSCDMYCVKAIDNLMSTGQTSMGNPYANINNVAAMIVEPSQSSAGYITPPTGFLKKLRELADKYGFLLIADEIQTGMGRTGKMFACEHSGIAPDILLVGKALGAGTPMSAVVARAEIFDSLAPGYIVSTYAGSALGCAVANKVLDIFEEDNLVENCADTGAYLTGLVEKLKKEHPLVGSFTNRGIFLGIEFVRDSATKEPAVEETKIIVNKMKEKGVLAQLNGYHMNRISFLPPINIPKADYDTVFSVLGEILSELESKRMDQSA